MSDIRLLSAEELPQIGLLDTSQVIERIYDLAPPDGTGGGLLLHECEISPLETPSWGQNEIATRMTLWRRNHAEGCQFWGAFEDDHLVGFLLLSCVPQNGALEIYSIFVDRQHRAKGIGASLVSRAEEYCRTSKIRYIYVTTTLDGPAIRFYLKTGFHFVGLHRRAYNHPGGQAAFIKEILL